MRTLRLPDPAEIIKANQGRTEDALRFAPDVMMIPPAAPYNSDTGITIGLKWIEASSTSYLLAVAFSLIPVTACLNLAFWVNGALQYTKWIDSGVTLWELSSGAVEYHTKSFPSFVSTDADLYVQIKTTNAGYPARLAISRVFLSSRPFYAY
jgi:hypothetical protein